MQGKDGAGYNPGMPLIRKPGEVDDGTAVDVIAEGAIPEALASSGLRREVPAGARFFRQEAEADRCFFLERGEVALRRTSRKGAEVEVARIGAGEWFAEAVLFAGRRYPADAVAVSDCAVLEFRRASILASPDPGVAPFFLSLLARKCLALNARIGLLAATDARERVAGFVLGLCPGALAGCHGSGGAAGCDGSRTACSFALPKKKREIAAELGMSPETLSRALRRMDSEGYLRIRGPRVEIPSCARLRSLVED
jgi:CRP/FNR family transcriptional regulator, dissimilatory nitrate respiration regulator